MVVVEEKTVVVALFPLFCVGLACPIEFHINGGQGFYCFCVLNIM